jgi:hypothetical protein
MNSPPLRNRYVLGAALAAVAAAVLWTALRGNAPDDTVSHWATVERYCVACHNEAEFAGGVAFDTLNPDDLHADAAVWEAAIRKLQAGLMPPPDEPRPSDVEAVGLRAWLERTLDGAYAAHPNPGAPALHRLNRREYANAVRDLLDLPVDADALLPGDDASAGFDNIANALSVSPSLMQAYVSAAAKISRLAVGDPTTSAGIATYSLPRELAQAEHLDGMPLGTRGGLSIEHVFPLDAEYEIGVRRAGGGFGLQTVGADEPVEITLNGERVSLLNRGDGNSVTLSISAGPQTLGAAVVAGGRPTGVDDLYSNWAVSPGIQSVSITGPLNASGAGSTSSRDRIFVCRPEAAGDNDACAERILRTLASRAFRRPVDDGTLQALMEFFGSGQALRGFETGIQYALARVLVDPQFIYRFEREPENLADGEVYALDDYELASRLSFFLWSSIPDDELLAVAAAGGLQDAAIRATQVRRMLADPKAHALVDNFAAQWLLLRQLDTVNPASNEFDGNLRIAFKRETEMLFESILDTDASIVDLIDADYTFVDERLARHYGIPNIRGSRFRRVELDGPRRGVLNHGSILTVTSAPNRTSPVKRGAWILENILGTPAPLPPPGVETDLEETAAATGERTTIRQRLERHRADPDCASCHYMIDPLGFALENFDAIGRWRDSDAGQPVDASGRLWDGTVLAGPAGLREALLARREMFVIEATDKLLTYALGRPVEHFDMPAVRAIVRGASGSGYRFSELVLGIVESTPFRMKTKMSAAPANQG